MFRNVSKTSAENNTHSTAHWWTHPAGSAKKIQFFLKKGGVKIKPEPRSPGVLVHVEQLEEERALEIDVALSIVSA